MNVDDNAWQSLKNRIEETIMKNITMTLAAIALATASLCDIQQ